MACRFAFQSIMLQDRRAVIGLRVLGHSGAVAELGPAGQNTDFACLDGAASPMSIFSQQLGRRGRFSPILTRIPSVQLESGGATGGCTVFKGRNWRPFCLFLVITAIVLGLQVYGAFHPFLNIGSLVRLGGPLHGGPTRRSSVFGVLKI